MTRFYKYILFRVYSFSEKKDSTPIGDTVLIMCVVHAFQVINLGLFFSLIFGLKWVYQEKSLLFFIGCFLLFATYYFLVFYNGKYKNWFKEFKKESIEQRKINGIKVWLFCWGSIILFFIQAVIVILNQKYLL
ncbi:MAG: hypothetical protein Q8R57_16775 [Bacteroidota bacterium]|nr:hypothetical protein [Bacteroidota bacterium]